MKKLILNIQLICFTCYLAYSQVSGEVVVKIDGKKIAPQEEYVFNVDEPLKFEAEGLKPNSNIEIKIQKMGFPIQKENYKVGSDGKVFEVLETPEIRMKCKVDVCYWTYTGKEERYQFRLVFK
jgi:hypothetical protein